MRHARLGPSRESPGTPAVQFGLAAWLEYRRLATPFVRRLSILQRRSLKMRQIQVGDQAPDFEWALPTGERIQVSDFLHKKVVVLFFYPRDESPVCTLEACAFRDAYDQFVEAGAVVIGISGDSAESHTEFATRHALPFYLVSDRDNLIRKAFGVPRTLGLLPGRVTYVIDTNGAVRLVFSAQLAADRHVTEALRVIRELARPA